MKKPHRSGRVPAYKKKSFYVFLMGLFIILVMVASVLEVVLFRPVEEKVEYGDLTFVQTSAGWQAYTAQGQRVLIQSDPSTLEGISPVSFPVLDGYQKVYLSVDPVDPMASAAIQELSLNGLLSVPTVVACYEDSVACADYPIRTCADATSEVGVILLRAVNETVVTFENHCLTVQGEDLLMVADKLIADYYG